MSTPSKKRRLDNANDAQNSTQSLSGKGEAADVESPEEAKNTEKTKVEGEEGKAENFFPNSPSAAATDEDKRQWQGFCEIESDPAFFNVMLREFGVRGVKVQEVLGLDDAILAFLPKPVYGLIFLFRYREDDAGKQEETCPDYVWFANQISDNSCASVALLNVVNNIPDVELGEVLQTFRSFSKDFPPYLRGDAITNFEFVKRIHNSFARKSDMMNIDQALKEKFAASKRKKKSPGVKSKKSTKAYSDGNDAAFHFIAYMPIHGEVWKLDGLDRQPQRIDICEGDNWLDVVSPLLTARMIDCAEDQIQFSLMSLVRDPIISYREDLAANIKTLQALEARLDSLKPDWKSFTADSMEVGNGPDVSSSTQLSEKTGVTAEAIQAAIIPSSIEREMTVVDDVTALIDLRQRVISDQVKICSSIEEEEQLARLDEQKAAERRHDHGPLIRAWLGMLAENGILKELVEECG